jgi:hypothetical protein
MRAFSPIALSVICTLAIFISLQQSNIFTLTATGYAVYHHTEQLIRGMILFLVVDFHYFKHGVPFVRNREFLF